MGPLKYRYLSTPGALDIQAFGDAGLVAYSNGRLSDSKVRIRHSESKGPESIFEMPILFWN